MAFTKEQLEADLNWAVTQWIPGYTKVHQEIQQIIDYLLGKSTVVAGFSEWSLYYERFTVDLLSQPLVWDEGDKKVLELITKPAVFKVMAREFFDVLEERIKRHPNEDLYCEAIEHLKAYKLDEEQLLDLVIGKSNNGAFGSQSSGYGNIGYEFFDSAESSKAIGKYLVSVYPKFEKKINRYLTGYRSNSFLIYILRHSTIDPRPFWYNEEEGKLYLQVNNVVNTLTVFLDRYEGEAYEAFQHGEVYDYSGSGTYNATKYLIIKKMAELFPEKYYQEQLSFAFDFLEKANAASVQKDYRGRWNGNAVVIIPNAEIENEYTRNSRKRFLVDLISEDLFVYDKVKATEAIIQYFTNAESHQIPVEVYTTTDKYLAEKSVDLLAIVLGKYKGEAGDNILDSLLSILEKYDFAAHYDKIWAITKDKYKGIRFKAIQTLQKLLGEKAISQAEVLLKTSKNADQRQFMALLLAMIGTEKALQILNDALEGEKNDDARDVMLQTLGEQRYTNVTEDSIAEMVSSAKKRGKLDKPVESWLNEAELPKLKYKSGKELDAETVRFVLYRMSRAKEIRPDIEAKPVWLLIDKQSSTNFANAILQLYLSKGGDAKQKYCLTLAGMLGDNTLVDTLRKQITEWDLNKRGKMAEYAVGALALIGTNKALRAVELFSRKAKNGNVMSMASQSLAVAAEELGMDINQLADSIVPDLGFEGTFKHFTIDGEEYRAFVGNDFKITFFDSDNKKLKAIPKKASKELQNEFKELSKELREVVRLQSGRMERYLITQRKWKSEEWSKFFLSNPIMFVYAMRLIWGAFDSQNQLLYTFQCMDDGTLMNQNDEEIELSEETFIGMIHPLSLSDEEIDFWKNRQYESNIEPIFPQLHRPIVKLNATDVNLTHSEILQQVPFKAQIRHGWGRGSVGDGGMIEDFRKYFLDGAVCAVLDVYNMDVFGYMENSTFGDVYFIEGNSYRKKMAFGEVPPVVYSEVMSELQQLVPKKTEVEVA
ncbi:DUF4132 domain-containing protein [Cytophagaceae bacterium DM2B3-1]|uniref:DUF4132 domain-containing protein n=1 Tax=Xanthocytophaga flava TaxID=3048013 RepID=A0ABT7CXJ0_9BACT|nr:DUF4132 domain-containing protein [Xanthocytophaga flavus]MDJ1467485.1 DUF4132 domain-containing protein [Xanthocytophaga flavus]MDJ1498484.1 DUF4132 domain-containing protein [Xanthocytophaga flavus]